MSSSLFNLHAWQSFSTISVQVFLVYLLAWHPPFHTPYISLPNHCLLFAAHAHTITTCFTIVLRLCHLILVSLNPILGTLSCSLTPHTHLTILISASWSATSFSFLMGQISLPCNILLRTQLLYKLPLPFNDISLLVSSGTTCLNLFHPIHILVSMAASASPSALNMSPKDIKFITTYFCLRSHYLKCEFNFGRSGPYLTARRISALQPYPFQTLASLY